MRMCLVFLMTWPAVSPIGSISPRERPRNTYAKTTKIGRQPMSVGGTSGTHSNLRDDLASKRPLSRQFPELDHRRTKTVQPTFTAELDLSAERRNAYPAVRGSPDRSNI